MSWLIVDNHLAVKEGNAVGHLEAADVWDSIATGSLIFNGKEQNSPSNTMPDIWFRRWGIQATIELNSDGSKYSVSVIAKDGTSVDFVSGVLLDQVINENEWSFIENADYLRSILHKCGVVHSGEVTLESWLKLLQISQKESEFIVNMSESTVIKTSEMYVAPAGLTAKLYPYQETGYTWLDLMLNSFHSAILGDEMGVGKTLQAIALICKRASEGKKCLVIAPVSLLQNWKAECHRFAPSIKALIHHGTHRTGFPQELDPYDVVITSYGAASSDNLLFCQKKWDLLILDEAQYIKNPVSRRTKMVKMIPAKSRLAISGTPFENHLTDIWSITDFVHPGILGSLKEFKEIYTDDTIGASKLEPVLSSVMIRRLVSDVADDLPEKIVCAQPLVMSDNEAALYEEARGALVEELNLSDVKQSVAPAISLQNITKLRMFCTHPDLMKPDVVISGPDPSKSSIKYSRACELIEEIVARKEKILIFTSYSKMFDIFKNDLPKRFGVRIDVINGHTPVPERQKIVDWFNHLDEPAILVLNPRAAGVGLNIVGANHVIHYNPEWNPSLEDQASARAYRRGQKKPTFIYRLYYEDTVEEIINERLERKRDISNVAIHTQSGNNADLIDLVNAISKTPMKENQNDNRNPRGKN